MSSSTSLPLPPLSPTANASTLSTNNDDSDNDIGPVTKLAQKAAIEEQIRREKQAKIDAENLRKMAQVVGSTANALSIATKTGSPVRLSPKQKYSVELKGSSPKMSVAARARAMADVPSMPLRRAQQQKSIPKPQLQQQPQLTSSNSSNDNTNSKSNRRSGTNVSKAKQLLEEYGYEDNYTTSNENTSNENTDEEEEDYYYDVPKEDLFHTPRTPTNNNNHQKGQKFKSPLERSALQYTMSKSPDPYGGTTGQGNNHDSNEFHYQHHKVSSYNNSKQHQQTSGDNNYVTDMYGLDPDEIPEIQPSTSSQSSGGLFATAKGWLQSQRDKLHQLELERQVEDQRRKLVEEGRKQRLIEAERRRNFLSDGNNNMNYHSPSRGKKKQLGQQSTTTTTPERLRQQGMIGGVSPVVQQGNIIGTSSSFGCIDNSVLSNISNRSGSHESSSEQRSSSHPTSFSQPPQDDSESIEDDKPSAVITGMPGICDFGGVYTTDDQYDTVEDYAGVPRVDSRGNVLEMVPSGSMDATDDDDPLDSTEIDGIEDGEGNIGIGIGYGKDGKDMKVCMKISSPKPSVSGAGMSVNVDIPIPFDTRNDYGVHDGGRRYNNAEEQVHQHEQQPQEQGIEEEVDEDDPYFNSDIKIVPEPPQDDSLSSAPILQLSQMKSLISSGGLPPSLNFCKWKRLYSLTRDGDSFDQFLRMVEGHDRTVLVVKTTRNELFGGYADTRWEGRHRRQQAHDFYGSAQACLFKFPNYIGGDESNQQRGVNKIIIYKWSGANRYIQLCDVAKRTVAFGGGGDEGDFGLCIEDDFRRGTTGHCSTFENDPLCEEGFFDVMDLEVWGFTLDF